MKAQEIREKTDKELENLIKDKKEKLKKMRFSLANRQLKNTQEIRDTRAEIARAKTILKERVIQK